MEILAAVLDAIASNLADDGYARPSRNVFVKPTIDPWRAWIGVTGSNYTLDPVVGVFNEELIDIRVRAFEMMGKKLERRRDGPPLILTPLERISAECFRCSEDAPWHFNEKLLQQGVADNLTSCLRKFAFPFFSAHVSLEAIMEAWKDRMGSYALPNFVPIIFIKLGRLNDLETYVELRTQKSPDEHHADEYREYVRVLLKMLT